MAAATAVAVAQASFAMPMAASPGAAVASPPPRRRFRWATAAALLVPLIALELASALVRADLDGAAGEAQHRATEDHYENRYLGSEHQKDSHPMSVPRRTTEDHRESYNGTGTHHGEGHSTKIFEPVLFFVVIYFLSGVAQQSSSFLPVDIPHSVQLFLLGACLTFLGRWAGKDTEFGRTIDDFEKVDPHVIFYVFLPALLYEDSSGVKWHAMKKVLGSSIVLAIPGVILNTVLTGALIKFIFEGVFHDAHWPWTWSFLLASTLSATDPVAVVGALHSLAAPDKLSLLISGESLLNDGSAMVLFQLFLDAASGKRRFEWGYSLLFFVRLALGGPICGYLIGVLATPLLKRTSKFDVEVLVLIVCVFGSFFVAEHGKLHVSGVLAVVTFGFFQAAAGQYSLQRETAHNHHVVFNFLALLSNEAIFVKAGVVGSTFFFQDTDVQDWVQLGVLYVIIHVTRAFVVLVSMPFLTHMGYGLTWKEALVCVLSGLRGAVGLAMALLVYYDPQAAEHQKMKVKFHVSGIVMLTLLINGVFITPIYKKLEVYRKPAYHDQLCCIALLKAGASLRKVALSFERHWFFHNCHLRQLIDLTPDLVEAAHNMSQHEGHMHLAYHHDYMSSQKLTTELVHDVMSDLAKLVGFNNSAVSKHVAAKVNYCRQLSSAYGCTQNLFLQTWGSFSCLAHAEDTHTEIIEIALRIAGDENARMKAKWEQEHQISCKLDSDAGSIQPDVSAAQPPSQPETQMSQRELSRAVTEGKLHTDKETFKKDHEGTWKMRAVLQIIGIGDNPFDKRLMEIASNAPSARERAAIRWQIAVKRVVWALKMVTEAHQIRRTCSSHFESSSMPGGKSEPVKLSSTRKWSSSGHAVEAVRNAFSDQIQSVAEMHVMILNISRHIYDMMYEAGTLTRAAHRVICNGLEYQEEAIEGSLNRRWYKLMCGRKDTDLVNDDLLDLHLQGAEKQMSLCYAVAWQYMELALNSPVSVVHWALDKVGLRKIYLRGEWRILKRDLEITLAFIMTMEGVIHDLRDILGRSDLAEKVRKPMEQVVSQAKGNCLHSLMNSKPAMFLFCEHVLCARLIVNKQQHLLEHLRREGVINDHDHEHLQQHVLKPSMHALDAYTPTLLQLKTAYPNSPEYHSYARRAVQKVLDALSFSARSYSDSSRAVCGPESPGSRARGQV